MDDINTLFFELTRVAIGNQVSLSRTPKVKEWQELYAMAKKQSLVGICFAGVQRLAGIDDSINHKPYTTNFPEVLYLRWMGMAAKIQQRNDLVNRQCAELQAKLSADGKRSCILKGQSIAMYYGMHLSTLRQSGDIDVWVDGSRNDIIKYVNSIKPTKEIRWLHASIDVFPDTEVEVHFIPSYLECPWHDRFLQRFFESERERCFVNSACSIKFNRVFILAHAFRHLFGEGIGLRQLMDYYYVLQAEQPSLDEKLLFQKTVNACGMYRFAKAIMWIMQRCFGLQDKYLLCDGDFLYGEILLSEVQMAGNFGHYDHRLTHNKSEPVFCRFIRLSIYNLRVFNISPWAVFWSPIWRIRHWIWRKINGYN